MMRSVPGSAAPPAFSARTLSARTLAMLTFAALAPLLTACGPRATPDDAGRDEAAATPTPEYVQEITAARAEREESLRRDDSWLTLVGLFWLEEGDSTFGSAADNALVFPEKAPAHIGTLTRTGDEVRLRPEPGVGLTLGEEPLDGEIVLAPDSSGEPTELTLGTFTFYLIERTGRYGIRLKDRESPARLAFSGIEHFPLDPRLAIEARFEPYDPPKPIKIPNILGTEFDDTTPGALVFTVGGEEVRLEPTGDPAEGLFLVFGDGTNGKETYGGGRFLSVPPPTADGTAVVDFNLAYNPPCVFSPYATCPLPPRQNRLTARIEAGEKMYGEDPHAGAGHGEGGEEEEAEGGDAGEA